MNKSVLVIDTPKKCDSCMYVGTFNSFCKINCRDIEDLSTKPDWCPLKPLPERKEYIVPIDNVESQKDIIAVGWNACIDEITGGEVDDKISKIAFEALSDTDGNVQENQRNGGEEIS